MVEDDRGDVTPGKWEEYLGVATVGLIVCVLVVTIVRLAVGWGSGSWEVVWQAFTVAFALVFLLYLGSGDAERALELETSDTARKPTAAAVVGRAGAVLLTLTFVGNLAGAVWEGSQPIALVVGRDVIGGGFAVCVIAYLALRAAERRRARARRDQAPG